ncbi:MAG TPA: hypothetical protein EYM29_07610 [Rhodospirillales bacterium]|nr:hypothetical protein [Rhodospirillales bacterium]
MSDRRKKYKGGMVRPLVCIGGFRPRRHLSCRQGEGEWRLEAVIESMTRDGQDLTAREAGH